MPQKIWHIILYHIIGMISMMNTHPGLYTDHYELTMAQGYFLNGKKNATAVFDYFFRKLPYEGGYVVFAGLADLLELLQQFRFHDADLEYLETRGFDRDFLSYLENFQFSARVDAVEEGEIVFPYEPSVRVEGNIIEIQLIETLLLNILNFESLIATKAARIRQVAGDRFLVDFGLRRAHGYGGVLASKAAIAGGFNATSNVFSARRFGLQSSGTMAHSWVQTFENELTAFRTFAKVFPDDCILLVDTYDTLKSGIPNAVRTGLEMKEEGKVLKGIRRDSGDLAYLSKKARQTLDQAGLEDVQIIASNQIDEYVIQSLTDQSAPIDAFGVGTALVTGQGAGALDGVYKMSAINGTPSLKISENIKKVTLPGKKVLYRFRDQNNMFAADGIGLEEENEMQRIHHPFEPEKSVDISQFQREILNNKVMANGKITTTLKSPEETGKYVQTRLEFLPAEHRRFMNPHIYRVGISSALYELRDQLRKGQPV